MKKDKVIEILEHNWTCLKNSAYTDAELDEALEYIIKVLEQESKTGKWIKTPKAVMGEGFMWYCNKCEQQTYQDSSKAYPSEKYCPNCGAKMKGEK